MFLYFSVWNCKIINRIFMIPPFIITLPNFKVKYIFQSLFLSTLLVIQRDWISPKNGNAPLEARRTRGLSLSLPFFAVAVALEKTDSLPRPSLRRRGHLRVKICSMAHNRLCRSGCSSRWFSVPRPLLYASSSLDIKAASTYASWIAPRFKQRYEADNGDKFRSGAMKSSFIASSIFFYFLSLLFCLHLVLDHEESEEKFPFTEFPEE